jgi:hypothetical protein
LNSGVVLTENGLHFIQVELAAGALQLAGPGRCTDGLPARGLARRAGHRRDLRLERCGLFRLPRHGSCWGSGCSDSAVLLRKIREQPRERISFLASRRTASLQAHRAVHLRSTNIASNGHEYVRSRRTVAVALLLVFVASERPGPRVRGERRGAAAGSLSKPLLNHVPSALPSKTVLVGNMGREGRTYLAAAAAATSATVGTAGFLDAARERAAAAAFFFSSSSRATFRCAAHPRCSFSHTGAARVCNSRASARAPWPPLSPAAPARPSRAFPHPPEPSPPPPPSSRPPRAPCAASAPSHAPAEQLHENRGWAECGVRSLSASRPTLCCAALCCTVLTELEAAASCSAAASSLARRLQ